MKPESATTERQLGRIQACHSQVADLYEMRIEENKQGTRLVWQQKAEQQPWIEAREAVRKVACGTSARSGVVLSAPSNPHRSEACGL